jgi:ABC-type transport system involved in cytochrome c biogenesis permease component
MMRGLVAALAKDLRLLARDRAGLIFLTIAPIVVITVAGLSLASLYGADPTGTTAYVLPIADEDAGAIGHAIRERLATVSAVRVRVVPDAAAARALVTDRTAGVALVVPAGTSAAVADGRPATLGLYTDPVKYLEVANVRALVQELRHRLAVVAASRARKRVEVARRDATLARKRVERAVADLRVRLDALGAQAAEVRRSRARLEHDIRSRVATAADAQVRAVRGRLAAALTPLRAFLDELRGREQAFADWLAAARRQAGAFADRLPPPPEPPSIPPALAELATADPDALTARLVGGAPPGLELPALPDLPAPPERIDLPALPEPPALRLPGSLGIAETSVTGAPRRLNTFDQNVPGFSVTFLLLGMLLGVSLGLLDERDWGTLERLRATPTPFSTVLVAKLLARFVVGVAQMVVLLAVGRLVFGVSLGPQPWALLLPSVGIVFAGTAFGLVVAGIARSREAVLPVGSIVIVTMAAVGGCWWPIDLEPPWMRQAALAFPTTWAMAAFNDLMIRRQPASAVVEATGVLLGFGALYLMMGLALFARQVRRAG